MPYSWCYSLETTAPRLLLDYRHLCARACPGAGLPDNLALPVKSELPRGLALSHPSPAHPCVSHTPHPLSCFPLPIKVHPRGSRVSCLFLLRVSRLSCVRLHTHHRVFKGIILVPCDSGTSSCWTLHPRSGLRASGASRSPGPHAGHRVRTGTYSHRFSPWLLTTAISN